ncbi:MAG: PIN domain-containing protein [Segetibacter sp.]
MAIQYLIDTSVAIKYINQTLPQNEIAFIDAFINEDCTISFVSEIELQVWNPANPNDIIVYQEFVLQSHIIGINPGIISETIAIRKNYKLKIADAIIAATALTFDITLVADNDNDFDKFLL